MTLTTRLTLFFLGLLALVLLGFSAGLYLLAHAYLHGQAAERLDATLDTLSAAVEIGPEGVEWEPAERGHTLQPSAPGGERAWLVTDERGRIVDRSGPPGTEEWLHAATDQPEQLDGPGGSWLVGRRWLQAATAERTPGREKKYAGLAIAAGVALEPVGHTLRMLAGALAAVSLAVWLAALAVSRAVCRRALRPVRGMAAAARVMVGTDPDRRLPVAATRDELEDLSRSFNGLLDRLHESFERQQRFTGDASHQLRTPLTAVLGQIEVALRRERGAGEYRATLEAVQTQALHLRRIVEALLFLARADAEARLPGLEPVALRPWLAEHLRGWSPHPRAADLRAEGDREEALWVEVQPELLGELVDILLENACKYSPPGTPVTVRLTGAGGMVRLDVEDQGGGIAPVDLPHLFEPFFRSAAARRQGVAGLGLGLAIARRLARAFGGTLTVVSAPGQGSRFTLSLPAMPRSWRSAIHAAVQDRTGRCTGTGPP